MVRVASLCESGEWGVGAGGREMGKKNMHLDRYSGAERANDRLEEMKREDRSDIILRI